MSKKTINIKNFEFFLISERLHVNKEIDEYSDKIYSIISTSNKSIFEFTDLPKKLNISKLVIKISDMKIGLSGQLDLNKSFETENGWIIHIDLDRGFRLYVLKHELNHALRLTLIGKDKMIKNLNHIKAQNIFGFKKDADVESFFYLIYLSNEEEINAKIMETNGLIKEVMVKWDVNKLSKEDFDYIIKSSDAFKVSSDLINFRCENQFKNWEENKLNKLFYILEENKSDLDRIYDSKFTKLKLIIKAFRDLLWNKTGYEVTDRNIYKPKRGIKFYNGWIPSQGEKLRKKIYSLYDHYR